jgi:biotin-(acetyl-CoA carboxylase) ligase
VSAGVPEDLRTWADAIEAAIAGVRAEHGWCCVSRVRVFAEVGSTQDAARAGAGDLRDPGHGGLGGLVVTCGRQTAGRGRLGRVWHDGSGQDGVGSTGVNKVPGSVSVTLAVRTTLDDRVLSMAAGLAALDTVRAMLAQAGVGGACGSWSLGLKEPNDVIAVRDRSGERRKLAGVLIERAGPVRSRERGGGRTAGAGPEARDAFVGIGLNVTQPDASAFDVSVRDSAASLQMIATDGGAREVGRLTRVAAVCGLVGALSTRLAGPPDGLCSAWQSGLIHADGTGIVRPTPSATANESDPVTQEAGRLPRI